MKKRNIGILGSVLVAALLFAALPQAAQASDGIPVDVVIALPGGATNTLAVPYAVGIATPANSAFRPLAVSYVSAGLTTNTITLGKAAGGAAWKSITVTGAAAAKGVTLITDEWYWRRGDTIAVSATTTNAVMVTIHGLER